MDGLQFEKAEFADARPKCTRCQSPIEHTYFHLAGQMICSGCAEIARAGQQSPENKWVLRGFFRGLGMAILCAVGYAIFTYVTNIQLALLAIGVGWAVGTAVRKGSRGLGGRRCQILAVGLTYFAITISYLPLILQGAAEGAKKSAAAKSGKPESAGGDVQPSAKTSGIAPVAKVRAFSFGSFLIALAILVGVSLAAPFFGVASGFSGIIGLLIIFWGLQQAWKQTARDERLIMGPYSVEENAPAV